MNGKIPDFVLVVSVEEAFMHCSKSSVRSRLWKPETWTQEDVPTLAHWVTATVRKEQTLEEVQAIHDRDRETRLY